MTIQMLSDKMLSYIWAPDKHDPEWKSEALHALYECCKESNNVIGEWLCGRCSLKKFPVEKMLDLQNKLESTALRNALREVTIRARRYNPNFPLAHVAIEIRRPANPVNPELYTADNVSASRDLLAALELAIRRDFDELTPYSRVGLLLLSAAYYGALMDIPQLTALTELDPTNVIWACGIPEFRLRLAIRGQPDAEIRQWFPDPMTLALLCRCGSDLTALRPYLAKKDGKLMCIQAALGAGQIHLDSQPPSLSRLFELLRMQRQTQLPQVLINYAQRQGFVTHPVRLDAWKRLHGAPLTPTSEIKHSRKKLRGASSDKRPSGWLTKLCREVRKGRVTSTEDELPSNTLEAVIVDWASFLLQERSFYGNRLQPKTIANYVRDVGAGLDNVLAADSILNVSPDALEEVYESLLEAQPTAPMKRNLGKALLEFHGYLQTKYAYPPISPYATLGIGKTAQFVDAQIISEEQYRRVLHVLARGQLNLRSPRLARVAQIMVILGYRLGLRRNEALKLLRRDIQLPTFSSERVEAIRRRHPSLQCLSPEQAAALNLPVHLHIRPHAQRALKTRNSTRSLPLHIFLEPDELEIVKDWVRVRDEDEGENPYSEFLFCIPELQTLWVSESSLMPVIHAALRNVTGCDDTHYHHLRHSAATWLAMKLMSCVQGVEERVELIFGSHTQTMEWLKDNQRLKKAFFHSTEAATRRVMHITSAVLGHASPKTSLLHYIHSMSWLSALCWQWEPTFWPPGHVIANIAQVSLPTKPDAASSNGISTEIMHVQRIIGRIGIYKRAKKQKVKTIEDTFEWSGERWVLARMKNISAMLAYQAHAEATGQKISMDWVEFSEEGRSAMLERARHIQLMGKHRLKGLAVLGSRVSTELVPRPPKHGGLAGVEAYADRLYGVLGGRYKTKANRVIDDFIERCWASDTTLRFYAEEDVESAREYLWILSELGIPLIDIELIIYDQRSPKQTKSLWREILRLPRSRFIEHAPENKVAKNTHLGIRASLRLKNATTGESQKNKHSGSALRYLFLMASIDCHFQ